MSLWQTSGLRLMLSEQAQVWVRAFELKLKTVSAQDVATLEDWMPLKYLGRFIFMSPHQWTTFNR